jgi:Lrp/AsnC family leucine-responsive transcriptional regulator
VNHKWKEQSACDMDEIDQKILAALVAQGRLTWAELGDRVKLSAQAASDRVRRLENDGTILGYAARLQPDLVGRGVAAQVAVSLERPAHRARFLKWVYNSDDVVACHHVAGEEDYLLSVRCGSLAALEALVSDELKGLEGVARTRTMVVLSTVKDTALLPAPPRPKR